MADDQGVTRRTVIGAGAAALATVAVSDLFHVTTALAAGPTAGVGYFARFGVTEKLLRDTISQALSKGGDYADVFFQHRVSNNLALEDGSVNRASANVGLGVGVRVLKGDQTGYGFTEDITADGLKRAALTAAAIAEGQAKTGPARFKITDQKPNRYPVKV